MKKGNGKSFLAGFIVCAVMMGGTVAFAEPVQKTINAVFGQVKLVVDGKPVEQETLLYNGSTYVPLRAAAEALGKEVGYDAATKTAYIGQVPAEASESKPAPVEQTTTPNQSELELEYLKYMMDVYYGVQASVGEVEAETARLESDPMLLLDENWRKDYKLALDEFSAQFGKLSAYDQAKVPETYKEFHSSFVLGGENFQKGMDKLFVGIENLDEGAILEAQGYIDEAVKYFDKAAELAPDLDW